MSDAKLVYARQHGFNDWSALVQHLQHIPADATGEPFLAVFEAGSAGNWERATSVLAAHPDIVRARGTNGNTMLNLASSRSVCPTRDELKAGIAKPGRLSAVQLLLQADADVNAANDRGWTPLHQAAYRNDPEMVQLFLSAGAFTDRAAHGTGGTPLAVAAFWGHREAADVLAHAAVVPANLRIAASVGRCDLIAACFDANGELTTAAKENRAFYRPHSGFPDWKPSDDAHEVLDEVLVWAAKSGRIEILDLLVEHGAYPNLLTTFGGLTHGRGVTALHLAAQNNHPEAVRALLEYGADPSIKDALYNGTPRGWAEHHGASEVLSLLEENQ